VANVRNLNTDYVDSTGTLNSGKAAKVVYIIVTATSASAVLLLTDTASGNPKKLNLRVADANSTQVFDFSNSPIVFPNGVRVETLTNAVATVVYTTSGGL